MQKEINKWTCHWDEEDGWRVYGDGARSGMTVVLLSDYDAVFSRYEHSETKVQWLLHDSQKLVKERDELKSVLEAVRSQMCWERDRDQLTMGFKDLHDDVTKVLGKDET